MAKVYENIHNYNDADNEGEVAVAPKGSTFPGDLSVAADPFEEVGWISEDGVGEEVSGDDEPTRAFQGNTVVKRTIPESETSFTFSCLEENAVVHGLKTRGALVTVEAGVATTVRNRDTDLDERAWRIRLVRDNGTVKVYEFTGVHTLSGTVEHKSTDLTIHEFTVKPIGPVTEITDDADIVAAYSTP